MVVFGRLAIAVDLKAIDLIILRFWTHREGPTCRFKHPWIWVSVGVLGMRMDNEGQL